MTINGLILKKIQQNHYFYGMQNAGCFAFDEYKEYITCFHGKHINTERLRNEIAEEFLTKNWQILLKSITDTIHTLMEICMPVHVVVSDSLNNYIQRFNTHKSDFQMMNP